MPAFFTPTSRRPYFLAVLASLLSLAGAYIAQYGFGLYPCELCLLQRVPYAVIAVLCIVALALPRRPLWMLLLLTLLFLTESGIASYHSLVEKHWIAGPTSCTASDASSGQSVDDFLAKIKRAPIVACDSPAWDFHGITMAMVNAVWSLTLTAAFFIASQQWYRKDKADA